MSVISGQRGSENINQDARKYSNEDKLWMVDPEHAVLAFFARKLNKKSVTDPEYRWWEKEQPSRTDAVDDSNDYTSGDTTITVDDGDKFRAGDVVMDVATGEQMRVTGVSTDDLTVSRGWGTTSAGALTDNDVLVILGNANAEGADVRAALTNQKTKKVNYTQIYREPIDMTGTMASTETYGGGDDLVTLRKEHRDIHMKDIERSFIFGEPKEDTSGSQPIRATGGLNYFISTYATDASGALTETEFETWIRSSFTKGGDKKMGFLSPLIASAVNSWAVGKLQMYPKDKTYGIAVSKYLSVHGELDFVVEKLFAENSTWNGYGFAVEMEKVGYRYLAGNGRPRDTKLLEDRQDNGEDEVIEEYLTEAGFFLAVENRHSKLYGVTSYS